ncbi:MAG: hypothetical protein ACE1ZI_01225, partial [Acidobacteriota bacterium]
HLLDQAASLVRDPILVRILQDINGALIVRIGNQDFAAGSQDHKPGALEGEIGGVFTDLESLRKKELCPVGTLNNLGPVAGTFGGIGFRERLVIHRPYRRVRP